MIPYEFEFVRPQSVSEAISLLSAHDEARLLAGGHTLLPLMKLRLARPRLLVDISRLHELRGVEVTTDGVSIGAATTHAELEAHHALRRMIPLFSLVGQQIADPTVRNCGTIGGSLVNADPSADWPAVVLALDAEMEITGPNGIRRVPAAEFFLDFMTSAVGQDEILTRIHVPLQPDTSSAYRKFRHPASGYAVAGVAVVLRFDKGRCIAGRIGITGVAQTAFNAAAAEALLPGCEQHPRSVERIAAASVWGIEPLSDKYADGEYRLQLARVMAQRALTDALGNRNA